MRPLAVIFLSFRFIGVVVSAVVFSFFSFATNPETLDIHGGD
jgi:hypothetical protein